MNADRLLWNSLKEGNKQALESIYRQNFNFLYQYGLKFSRDEATVQDCIQELFIEIWNHRKGLSSTDSIRKYLLVSIRRKIIRQLRKNEKTTNDPVTLNRSFKVELSIEEQWINDEINTEQIRSLKKAMSKLSDRQREIIYLKYQAGMDNKSIADVLNINYQSVRNLVSRSLKALKKEMM